VRKTWLRATGLCRKGALLAICAAAAWAQGRPYGAATVTGGGALTEGARNTELTADRTGNLYISSTDYNLRDMPRRQCGPMTKQ
jgi:predicted Zn-dependent protease